MKNELLTIIDYFLQKNLKELKKVDDKAPRNVTNALFVGSTSELQKLINGKKEGKNE